MLKFRSSSLFSQLTFFIKKKINGRDGFQGIIKNLSWLLLDKVLRMGVGLFVGVWSARYLGVEQFGSLNFAIAFVALFGAFASLGLDVIVVRDLVREPEKKYDILASTFFLKLIGGSIAFLMCLGIIFLIRPSDKTSHFLVTIFAIGMIFQSFDTIDLWFQSQVKSKFTVIAKNFAFVIFAIFRIVLIQIKAPIFIFAFAVLGEIIFGAIGMLIFYIKRNSIVSLLLPKKNIAIKLLKESWPMILSNLAIMIYMRIDQIMIGQMINNKEVGIYSAALRFSEIWYFIPMAIVGSVMPALTLLHSESKEKYFYRLQQLLNNLVKIAYLIAIPMTFISTLVVTTIYGQEFSGAGLILSIHIWSAVFVFIGVGMSPYMINEGLIKYSAFQTIFGAITNIIMNLFLIPKFGAVGAAISTLISQMIAAFLINAALPPLRILFKMQLKALIRPFWKKFSINL
jgi:PST family polysaccharide transporter